MNNRWMIVMAAVAALGTFGCENQDGAGMSKDDAKQAVDSMPPEEKIKFIASSPLNAAEKEKRYKEIEAKTGVKAADVLKGRPTGIGAGG